MAGFKNDSTPEQARRLLVVSNRLPVTITPKNGEFRFRQSAGGLVSGLSAYLDSLKGTTSQEVNYLWMGWPGISIEDPQMQKELSITLLKKFNALPVFIDENTMDIFYHGFCNKLIWPLFHYFPSYAIYDEKFWEYYKNVNSIFADYISEIAKPGDIIWIHDYHLMLVPGMLREKCPDASIGFFLHIPFPSFEIFRLIPEKWRQEILFSLLGADLIGFHTNDYTQYFLRCVLRILGYENSMGEIMIGERVVKVDTFPMGIDFEKFHRAVSAPKTAKEKDRFLKVLKGKKAILSVDRLDYSKGIINRLIAYRIFLEKNPEWHKRVVLILVVVPSRIGVEHYQRIKKEIDEAVGAINGTFGSLEWAPIIYQYKFLPFYPLVALYSICDVALVTPLRDGMNLVAKEYLASRSDRTGVLILSETAGASEELREAIIVNPNNPDEVASLIKNALEMDIEEQRRRNGVMQNRLQRYNVSRWAKEFLDGLQKVKEIQKKIATYYLTPEIKERLRSDFKRSRHRLLLLDYDGTLVPFVSRPDIALPDDKLLEILRNLSNLPEIDLVLISGRDRYILEKWFKNLNLGFVAEHGVWIKEKDKDWQLIKPLTNKWIDEIQPIMEIYVDRLPGSFIEKKEYSIVWHYRNANKERAGVISKQLIDHLINLTANLDLQILSGSRVVEIRNSGVNKGTAAMNWLSKNEYDFITAMGDDWTDEDLFKIFLDTSAYTIKVGTPQSYAKYYVRNQKDVRALLEELTKE